MKNRNLLIIILLAAIICVAAVLAVVLPRQRTSLKIVTPDGTERPLTGADVSAPESEAVRAYLLITVDGRTYAPYPLTRPGRYTVTQAKKNARNVIHVTEDSVYMEYSTCANQLCVTEGVVTLENKAGRILGNYIMCLPNGVTLELLSAQELRELEAGGT